MKISKFVLAAFISAVFFVSCSNDLESDKASSLGSYDKGIIILNEGGFGKGNASISFVPNDFSKIENNIFSMANPTIILGDTGQDIGLHKDLAFIVLNVSNKIEVVNRYTMSQITTIKTDLNNPRYIAFSNGKAYVTNWGDGGDTTDDYVAVINLNNYSVETKIPVAEGPERIIENNNKLYIAHKGGYGSGKTISVINIADNKLQNTITVGDIPNAMEIQSGTLYVLCEGKSSYTQSETAGSFVKINLSNNTVSSTLDFPEKTHPSHFKIEGDSFYYTIGSEIYKSSLSASTLPTNSLFTTTAQGTKSISCFAVKNNKIYIGDAGDNRGNGKIYVYTNTGTLEYNYQGGIIPGGFYFNE